MKTYKHLLIDYDSTIPNLALMKISSWAKQKGDQVYLNQIDDEPDYIWLIKNWCVSLPLDLFQCFLRLPEEISHGESCISPDI